uniref:Uncharacterized protein n=1 Tax=Schizaphis graminum TaxID=13262 RepID=A0A2S2NM13_SCHGA
MAMINSFKVIPAAYVYPNSHRKSCEWVFVGRDDSRSKLVIATKAEMAEANRFHLLSREVVDVSNDSSNNFLNEVESSDDTSSLKNRVNVRADRWKSEPLKVVPYKFDTKVHYPFGAKADGEPVADIVYRHWPIYNESVVKQMMASVASSAAKRHAAAIYVGAGVPRAPIVRQLFIDAMTGQPIADLAPESPTENHSPLTAPLPSPTSNLQFGFNHLKIKSPTKLKYSFIFFNI